MISASSYAAFDATSPLRYWDFERRDVRPEDVEIDVLYCGVCHSDLHAARDEWGEMNRPFVPGHEIVGRVASVGAAVTQYKVGDLVGVGCLVDGCLHCTDCEEGLEQYCDHAVGTYMGVETGTGRPTYGGYSSKIVVTEPFVLKIPDNLDPAAAAPLLCAGITTWSPLRHWKVGPGPYRSPCPCRCRPCGRSTAPAPPRSRRSAGSCRPCSRRRPDRRPWTG